MVMASSRLKCHQKKCAGFAVEGVRNVRYKMSHLYDEPEVTATVERIAAAEQSLIAA
jgi:hypothetical protein